VEILKIQLDKALRSKALNHRSLSFCWHAVDLAHYHCVEDITLEDTAECNLGGSILQIKTLSQLKRQKQGTKLS